jgi:hypothetical protein
MHPLIIGAIGSFTILFIAKQKPEYVSVWLQFAGLLVKKVSEGCYLGGLYGLLTKKYSRMVKIYTTLPSIISIFKLSKTPVIKLMTTKSAFHFQF